MFILSFYTFALLYTTLLMWVFPVDFFEYTAITWYLFLAISALIGFVLSFLTQLGILQIVGLLRQHKPKNDPFNHKFTNSLLRLGLHLIRTKVILSGEENIPTEPFVLVGNHQENYDIIVLKPQFRNTQIGFIAKEALAKLPIFGRWMTTLGSVFISRDPDRSAARSIVQAIKHFESGLSMGIFPEGKRSFGNDMIEFKAGAFKLAMKPKADLLIVTQYDTTTILKRFPWRRYRVYVHIHPILPYADYQHMNSHELSEFVKNRIQAQLDVFAKSKK